MGRPSKKSSPPLTNPITDAIEFMKLDLVLKPREIEIRRLAREVGEVLITPLLPNLTETAQFDQRIIEASKKLGPAGLQCKGRGCAGLTNTEALLLTLELTRTDGSFGTFYLVHSGLAMRSIEIAGTEEQKDYWLPKMVRFEKIGAFGLTEPNYGSDATGLATTARKVDGGWVLNGEKRWIGNATFADVVIIWAKDTKTNDIIGFLVEKGMKGFKTSKIERKMSLRIVQSADIILDNCFVPDSHHLSRATKFSAGTQRVLESSRALVAAGSVGLLLGAYDRAIKYVLERKQFDRSVASFQLVQERMMRALGTLQAGILSILNLGRLMDKGEATMAHIALLKAWCTKYCREAIGLCRESMGGNGIILDYGVISPFLDMESLHSYEGTYDINVLVAGRLILGQNAIS